jgi:hypothetical protein
MANGDGFVLNQDFWAPLQANKDGKFSIVGRFSKGDTLKGVELPDEFLEKALSGPRPMLSKKESEEAPRQGENETPASQSAVKK